MFPQARKVGYRPQYKKFIISCEGSVTEREYFRRVQALCWNGVFVEILSDSHKNSPVQVLERIRKYDKSLSSRDEMWCVVDKDQWTPAQFAALLEWQRESSPVFHGIALSNPKFELWLLAHFQELPKTCGASECDRLLEAHLPGYRKHIDVQRFDLATMRKAVQHASATRQPGVLPLKTIGTSVGELVARILDSSISTMNWCSE